MKIEIITIGTEVLAGFTINTNASFIGLELFKLGLSVSKQTTFSDEFSILKEGLKEALNHNQLIITTGGLGPTLDDCTRGVVAELFDSGFHHNVDIEKDLRQRFTTLSKVPLQHIEQAIQDQSKVPDKAQLIKNTVGTAPGLIFSNETCTMIVLPGVPVEMRTMFLEQVIPFLKKNFLPQLKIFRKTLHIFELPESAIDPSLREFQMLFPQVDFGIYPSQGILSVSLTTKAENEKQADHFFELPLKGLIDRFKENLFIADSGKIEEAIHREFIQRSLTLSTAESCTGGAIAARLTALAGASQFYLGSVIAYTNALKNQLLNVSNNLLKEKGAVSSEVVNIMAKSMQEMTDSDYSLAVSGIAGPSGGTVDKPVGTVYCAIGRKEKEPLVWKLQGKGNRETIIQQASNSLLCQLYSLITSESNL